jgi:hypothetical protein
MQKADSEQFNNNDIYNLFILQTYSNCTQFLYFPHCII